VDPTWQVMRVLARVGVIEIATTQRAQYPEPHAQAA
jgi:stearoyl-CoA desaturase (delta-9 desaturase)